MATFSLLSADLASTTNATSYAGNAGTPAAGDMLICIVATSGLTTAGSLTGGGWTWTNVKSFTKNAGADVINVFWAYASAATSTTPTFATGGVTATGCIISCIRCSGLTDQTNFTNSLKQAIVTNTGSTANPTVVFGSALTSTSGVIAFATNGTNSATQWTAPSGFTQLSQVSYNTPANSGQTSTLNSGSTATTLTWTNANTTAWGTVGIELISAVATSYDPFGQYGFFGL